jgi:hypothetical protein
MPDGSVPQPPVVCPLNAHGPSGNGRHARKSRNPPRVVACTDEVGRVERGDMRVTARRVKGVTHFSWATDAQAICLCGKLPIFGFLPSRLGLQA